MNRLIAGSPRRLATRAATGRGTPSRGGKRDPRRTIKEAMESPLGAHGAVVFPAAVNTYASLYRSGGKDTDGRKRGPVLPVSGEVAEAVEAFAAAKVPLEQNETTLPKKMLADAFKATKQYAYVFNALRTFSLDLPPSTLSPVGYNARVRSFYESRLAEGDARSDALRRTSMEFRIPREQVIARVGLEIERGKVESSPSGGVLDLEFESASARDLGVCDPADAAEANGDLSGSSSSSSSLGDSSMTSEDSGDRGYYVDDADLEERFDEIVEARARGKGDGVKGGGGVDNEANNGQAITSINDAANPSHPGRRTPWAIAPPHAVAAHPSFLQFAPHHQRMRMRRALIAATVASGERDPAAGGYDEDWEKHRRSETRAAEQELSRFESDSAEYLTSRGIDPSWSVEKKLEALLHGEPDTTGAASEGSDGAVKATIEDLNDTLPGYMRTTTSYVESETGGAAKVDIVTDYPAITTRVAHSRDRTGMRRKDTVANVRDADPEHVARILRVPGSEPWYARGTDQESQQRGIARHAEEIISLAGKVQEMRTSGAASSAADGTGNNTAIDKDTVVGGDEYNPITVGDVDLAGGDTLPDAAAKSPAALFWHLVTAGSGPSPAGAPFPFRGNPVETGPEKHAREIAGRAPSRRKTGAKKPKHQVTYIVTDKGKKFTV